MMSILGLVLSLVLILIAIAAVAYPLLRSSRAGLALGAVETNVQQQGDRLRIYYERVLTNIRDLDEDYGTGKLNESEYRREREVWVQRGIRLLRVLDSLDAQHSLLDVNAADADTIDRAIEAAVQAFREGKQPACHDLSGGGAS